ncbi:hypothetical protein GJ697_27215 [Pseudoduganella sp. FT25W]|uniref:Uncharacterized protein n=1 Tax=Duganella alba TaxID=2666081 RepID=A0A6L5QRQ3_9BURK|nr:hypothetical protein [Duganella alba]MRX11521.1 hypothetical protein [Duganella alba]MRX19764.1 hypothetical protein [Duganella alba]
MKKSIGILLLSTLCGALPLQAQNVDNLTPEQQKQLLNLLLLQQKVAQLNAQNGYTPQAAVAPAAAAPQRSDAELAAAFDAFPALTAGVQFERFRDGFAINGRRYIDPEGKITSYGFDAQSGDFTYLAETNAGEYVLKSGRALASAEPVTIATARKQGAQWQVSTVTGKKFTGYRLIPSSRGFVIARDNTGFRFVPGHGTTNIVAPETFTIAALQNGDIANTGYILLERTPESNGSQANNSLGSLFNAVKSLGSVVGVGKKEDYALLNIENNRLVPVNVSLEDKQVQVMSACRQRNMLIAQCDKMDSYDSVFQPNGMRNMSHYFWRINWFNVPGRPILVSQEGGLSKVSATDLNSGKKVILFERTLGIANFAATQQANGKISVTAQMGFSSETRDDVAALLDTLPDVAEKTAN